MTSIFIGVFIRTERIAREMTQKQLAQKVGYLSAGTISNIELGFQQFPLHKTQAFEDALGIEDRRLFQIIRKYHPMMGVLTLFESKALIKPKMIDEKTQAFQFKSHKLRTIIDDDGAPWWMAREVCDILGLTNITVALEGLDADERSELKDSLSSGGRKPIIINEPGLYSLILRSRKPAAKEFKRWITHEVLPAIRKTGRFVSKPIIPELPSSELTGVEKMVLEKLNATLSEFNSDWVAKQALLIEKHNSVIAENEKLTNELEALKSLGGIPSISDEDRQKIKNWDRLCCNYKGHSMTDTAKMIGEAPKPFIAWVMEKYFGKDGKPHAKWMFPHKNFFVARFKEDEYHHGLFHKDFLITPEGTAYFQELAIKGKVGLKTEKI